MSGDLRLADRNVGATTTPGEGPKAGEPPVLFQNTSIFSKDYGFGVSMVVGGAGSETLGINA